VVVLGHERCGAVQAAVDVVESNATFPGRIGAMVDPVIPAVLAARGEPGDLVANAVVANVRRVIGNLLEASQLLATGAKAGKIKVVGAVYDLEGGHVTFLDGA
jgi:carbonic anhydrase